MKRKKVILALSLVLAIISISLWLLVLSPLRFASSFVEKMYSVSYVNYYQSVEEQRSLYDDKFSTYTEHVGHESGEWIVEAKATYNLLTPIVTEFKYFHPFYPSIQCSFRLLISDNRGNTLYSGDVTTQINLTRTGVFSYRVTFLR